MAWSTGKIPNSTGADATNGEAKSATIVILGGGVNGDTVARVATPTAVATADAQLGAYCMTVNLIADCAFGRNRVAEAKCQSLFPPGDVLNAVCDPRSEGPTTLPFEFIMDCVA
jgi:hypothetical protein